MNQTTWNVVNNIFVLDMKTYHRLSREHATFTSKPRFTVDKKPPLPRKSHMQRVYCSSREKNFQLFTMIAVAQKISCSLILHYMTLMSRQGCPVRIK